MLNIVFVAGNATCRENLKRSTRTQFELMNLDSSTPKSMYKNYHIFNKLLTLI